MATHSSTLAWRIPWTEEPGGLQSMGSQRVGLSIQECVGRGKGLCAQQHIGLDGHLAVGQQWSRRHRLGCFKSS